MHKLSENENYGKNAESIKNQGENVYTEGGKE